MRAPPWKAHAAALHAGHVTPTICSHAGSIGRRVGGVEDAGLLQVADEQPAASSLGTGSAGRRSPGRAAGRVRCCRRELQVRVLAVRLAQRVDRVAHLRAVLLDEALHRRRPPSPNVVRAGSMSILTMAFVFGCSIFLLYGLPVPAYA